MLLFKRIVTSLVLFAILFVAVWFMTLVAGVAIVTTQTLHQLRAQHHGAPLSHDERVAAGRNAGREFGRKNVCG